jgi:hypothetical protein
LRVKFKVEQKVCASREHVGGRLHPPRSEALPPQPAEEDVMNPRAFILLALPLACTAQAALAYVGPGAGVTAIGTMLALLGAGLLAIVGFVWYPVKRLLARRRPAGPASAAAPRKR